MMSWPRLGVVLLAAAILGSPATPGAVQSGLPPQARPDYDVRDGRAAAPPRAGVDVARQQRPARPRRGVRVNPETGTIRSLDNPGISLSRASANGRIRAALVDNARALGLEPGDLSALTPIRDYVSRSTGVRHAVFAQSVDRVPVFDSAIAVHILPDGRVLRITSNGAPASGRRDALALTAAQAVAAAIADINLPLDSAPAARLVWFAMDGVLNLAWRVAVDPAGTADLYDLLFDAGTGELLLRRNRARYTEGTGRVVQSAGTAAMDPRLPDAMPDGPGACPPVDNYALRSLTAPFRDPATVLGSSGMLEGNNTRVFRGTSSTPAAPGVPDGAGWTFDFPFNTAASAETALFFSMNFVHDFFYDLGFDEAAGNFQSDNFGRGGAGGDPIRAIARANGRNNANYVHADEGISPAINMFLWDGMGCWGQDADGDGVADLDGDYDLDIIVHEFHHGVSLRLNTSFTGSEAGAVGEGGGDFFAYSVNNNTLLAEYARPGGLRTVNEKTYQDWYCRFGLFCEVHDNGEIWANVLWDLRERFRADLVAGTEAAAINETHQIYVDGLKLSPPAPTMLDMRDAMLEADAVRHPGSPNSQNYCRLWESFAGRGMGVSAADTQDNGSKVVTAAFDVPDGCVGPPAPPPPPLVTLAVVAASAYEAGPVPGAIAITRDPVSDRDLIVRYTVAGSAGAGIDYVRLSGQATILAGESATTVPIVPIDDTALENNETVSVALSVTAQYFVGSPSSGTVTIVSDDVAPDFTVIDLTVPRIGGAGMTIQVSDTTRNQGTGTAPASETSFYLSRNAGLDATDTLLGGRSVGTLAPGATSSGSTMLTLPDPLEAGTYYIFAKGDGPGEIAEVIEFNNTRASTIAVGPDLAITAMTGPGAAAAGSAIAISDTTSNTGGGTAPASDTQFFLSANALLDASDIALQSRTVGQLVPGGSSAGVTTVVIPAATPAGTFYLFGKADAAGSVLEASETNNTRAITIRIGGDLIVSSLLAPARAAAGTSISVTETTKNIGAGWVAASTTGFYLSANATLDASDIRLSATRGVPALAAGEQSTASTTLAIPEVAAGTWVVIANADDGAAVPETQEANNQRFTTLQVGPDLTLLFVTVPSTAVSGGTISVSETVKNVGAADAPATITRFYLSKNNAVDATDILLSPDRPVGPLAANASSAGTTPLSIPAGLSGAYYLIVVADGGNAVAESSEANNTTPRAIQISPGS